MISAKEALEATKINEDGSKYVDLILEDINKHIISHCKGLEYFFDYKAEEYKGKENQQNILTERIGSTLREHGYKVSYTISNRLFRIRWDGKEWSRNGS